MKRCQRDTSVQSGVMTRIEMNLRIEEARVDMNIMEMNTNMNMKMMNMKTVIMRA